MRQPATLEIRDHRQVLSWIESSDEISLDLGSVGSIHIWALVALAAIHSARDGKRVNVRFDNNSPRARFAHAVGFDSFVGGSGPHGPAERLRTVPLRRVSQFAQIDRIAQEISALVVQRDEAEDTRRTLFYILVEFLRNAVQHSQDKAGAIVGAQLMDKTASYVKRPMIQVAVADGGVGIMRTLQATYPEIQDAHEALVMAQNPWVSSQFERGQRGGKVNAGLGLFFIAEMAKRTAAHFLLASRGGALLLQGDQNYVQHHHIRDEAAGFPGTLAVFELPVGEVEDYEGLISVIQDVANQRLVTGKPVRLLRFEKSKNREILCISVRFGAEDTARAQRLVEEHILPRLARGESIELDFSGLRVCTQSFLHALLFLPLREAFRRNARIYIANARPAVVTALQFLEGYALPPPEGSAAAGG